MTALLPLPSRSGAPSLHLSGVAPDLLRVFNEAGVVGLADVHVAMTLARLTGEAGEQAQLAAALAVRAPRFGHVCVDLATVRHTVTTDDDRAADLDALPWPEPDAWLAAVRRSRMVGPLTEDRPLRLSAQRLYLDRYWRYERQVLTQLRARSASAQADKSTLRAGLDRLFPGHDAEDQRAAATAAVLRRFAVVAGGPGTGKTTTVARVLALIAEQASAAGQPFPQVALAAPTGKAARRLEEAVRSEAAALDTPLDIRTRIGALGASTIHRLLGRQPGNASRFRHNRRVPLSHDVVVVDETSMVPLALMAKLLDAVRPQARVVLLGDPEQLASVEAGAVLGDIVGPAAAHAPPTGVALGEGIVVLRRVHRFRGDSGIAQLAVAIQRGDSDAALAALQAGGRDLRWVSEADPVSLQPVREAVVAAGVPIVEAARAGDTEGALAALEKLRVLCAHRRGPFGVAAWAPTVERWLADRLGDLDLSDPWYVGRPVLATRNDYQLGVSNGDVGVVVARPDGGVTVAFPSLEPVSPTRLEATETVHAMTVHKAQGSQFERVVVVLPPPDSPLLTRELLYTAVTRARESLTLVGSPESVRGAVERRIQRASGLREALWGAEG